jgi:hypothetical protein
VIGDHERRWIAELTTATRAVRQRRDESGQPHLTAITDAYRLVWETEGAAETADAVSELWWLRLAERVVQATSAPTKVPPYSTTVLGIGRTPGRFLNDGPELRTAAVDLLEAARDAVAVRARLAYDDYRAAVWNEFGHLQRDPVDLDGYGEAVALVKARALLYRTASRLADQYVDLAAAHGRQPGPDVLRLQADLAATADASRPVLALPDYPADRLATAVALTRASVYASVAWDNLAIDPAAVSWSTHADPSAWLRDAALLGAHLAALDARWPNPLLAAAGGPEVPAAAAQALRWQVVPDCRATGRLGLQTYAQLAAQAAVQVPAWPARPPPQLSTADVPAALEAYLDHLTRADALLLPQELRQLASCAARLVTVVGDRHRMVDGSVFEPRQLLIWPETANEWRTLHHLAHQVIHRHTPGPGYSLGFQLADWADRAIQAQTAARAPAARAPAARAADPADALSDGPPDAARAAPGTAIAGVGGAAQDVMELGQHTMAEFAARVSALARAALGQLQRGQVEGRLDTLTPAVTEPGPEAAYYDDQAGHGDFTYVVQPTSHDTFLLIATRLARASESCDLLAQLMLEVGGTSDRLEQIRISEELRRTPPHPDPAPSPGPHDEALIRHTDVAWIHHHIRTAIASPAQHPRPGWTPHPIGPDTADLHADGKEVLDLVRGHGGDALARAVSNDPAWPYLHDAAATAASAGLNLPMVIAEATRAETGPTGSLAAVLAGRIRRIASDSAATTAPGTDLHHDAARESRSVLALVRRTDTILTSRIPDLTQPDPTGHPADLPPPTPRDPNPGGPRHEPPGGPAR